jgi:hypothetical protein
MSEASEASKASEALLSEKKCTEWVFRNLLVPMLQRIGARRARREPVLYFIDEDDTLETFLRAEKVRFMDGLKESGISSRTTADRISEEAIQFSLQPSGKVVDKDGLFVLPQEEWASACKGVAIGLTGMKYADHNEAFWKTAMLKKEVNIIIPHASMMI